MNTSNSDKLPPNVLSKQDWINLAELELSKHGINAIKVELLAKKLKVTKGSFYWHFKNRNELFELLLKRWRFRATTMVIERFDKANLEPEEHLRQLFLLPYNRRNRVNGAALETAIRNWSRTDKMVKQMIDEIDGIRLLHIASIFQKMGNDDELAKRKALRFYYTLQGMAMFDNHYPSHIEQMFYMLL